MKSELDELALFGGEPAFASLLHVGRPDIPNRGRFMERMTDILERRWMTNDGPYVREFERRIADTLGVRHAIAVCNGTVALELAIRAAGLTGEVIVPSYTFVATAHALKWQGITPVFCDIDAATGNINPDMVEGLLTPRTTGLIGVHLWGRPCPVDALSEIAARHNLTLLFDAAHAFGCSYKGRLIGGFGLAEVFSFHATKILQSFEGGAVTTNDDQFARKISLMRNFGFAGYDNVMCLGINGKMSEVCAAMGLTSLESLSEGVAANKRNYQAYRRQLAGLKGISVIEYDETEQCNFQYVVLSVDEAAAGLDRDDLIRVLQMENVLARRYFYPGVHRMQPYKDDFPNAGMHLQVTERTAKRVLVLPTGTTVGEPDVHEICSVIRTAVAHAEQVRERVARTRGAGQ
jgi:dTDP-4-amino-4,6-dideoxygalactose transaminase